MNLDMKLRYWKLGQPNYLYLYPEAVTPHSLPTDIFDRVFYRGSVASSDLGVNQNYPMIHAQYTLSLLISRHHHRITPTIVWIVIEQRIMCNSSCITIDCELCMIESLFIHCYELLPGNFRLHRRLYLHRLLGLCYILSFVAWLNTWRWRYFPLTALYSNRKLAIHG
jgi:hypothetical protein